MFMTCPLWGNFHLTKRKIRLAMVSPRPTPPVDRFLDLSPLYSGSKMCVKSSGEKPVPTPCGLGCQKNSEGPLRRRSRWDDSDNPGDVAAATLFLAFVRLSMDHRRILHRRREGDVMSSSDQRKISNLRTNSFAALIILHIEIGNVWV